MAEPPVTPERWRTTEEVLLAVWDAPPGERELLLDQRCAGDTALLTELRALLAADEAVSAWQAPAPEPARRPVSRAGPF